MTASFRRLLVAAAALALPATAGAQLVVESHEGSVLANGAPVWRGYRIPADSTLVTARGAQAVIRFGDSVRVALDQDSELRIAGSGASRLVLDLPRGAARVLAGAGARRDEFALRVPHASFALRSDTADFTVALVNPAYLSVAQGAVAATNSAGTVVLGAGTTASIASSAALATAVPAASFPSVASASVGRLAAAGNVSVAAGGPASGAAPAAGGVASGVGLGNVAIAAAAAAAAAAAGSNSGGSSTTTHH